MRVAIMQPYFFPYIGYFQLINATDKWIVFDTVQYIYHGWINRNRILHPQDGWQYIIVPLNKHLRDEVIKNVTVVSQNDWKKKILGQLTHYKKKAPYYSQTIELLNNCFSKNECTLSRLNTEFLSEICRYLEIKFNYEYFSEMDLDIENINDPGDWALLISERMGATQYINLPGGQDLFNRQKFTEKNIELNFIVPNDIKYVQKKEPFVENLSILDIMMWNSKEQILHLLKEYELK